jgi:cellulose synthase/poly-beta-1,6-N-acetylglucosamine synthase-like glycosyltransferase
VVDDRSTDRTAEIVEDLARQPAGRLKRLKLVRSTELPAGWTGKNHALAVGARAAGSPDFLLFVDADTRHAPTNISQAITYTVRNRVDMFSLIMPIVNVTFWEKVVQPMTGSMLCIRYPLWKVNNPSSKTAFGNGQYLLIRRQAYEAVGTHEAVKGKLLEDIAIARLIKQKGLSLKLAYTPDVSQIRMYRSLREIWQGWARIFLAGMDRSLSMMLVGVLMMLFFSLTPYGVLIGTLAALALTVPTTGLWTLLGISAFTVAVEMAVMARFYRAFQTDRRYVVLHLLGCLVALGILLWAITRLYSAKGLVWKGTRYDSRPKGDRAG